MATRSNGPVLELRGRRPENLVTHAQGGRKCCSGSSAPCTECGHNRLESESVSGQSGARHDFSRIGIFPSSQIAEQPDEETQGGPILTVQGGGGGTTPDGRVLGPTDPSKRVCLAPNRLIWVGGVLSNTATSANGRSRVTANLGTAPGDGADCDCGCGLFRQFIRGFWRIGSPTAPKRHDTSSCGNALVMNEASWTEEFEDCNPGGLPISATCNRVYLDEPGFASGLSDGTFVEVHLDLRYQMWDQCRGHEVATGDRRLRIRGDRHPRSVSFT